MGPDASPHSLRGRSVGLLLAAGIALCPPAAAADQARPTRAQAPPEESWRSETVAGQVDGQLAKIRAFLEANGAAAAERELAMVAADGYRAAPLRPAARSLVFTAPGARVWHGKVDPRPRPAASGRGAPPLAAALRQLLKPLALSTDIHAKFKVVGVRLGAESVVTPLLFSLSGPTAEGTLEMHAEWAATWALSGTPEASPRLLAVAVGKHQEALLRSPEGPTLFADATRAVFAGESSFDGHLMLGPDHWLTRLEAALGTDIMGHAGLAIGDADGDGLDDLYLPQHGGLPNRLYVQGPDGTVRDRAAWAGIDWLDRSLGALFVDLDNDGDQDLVVATIRGLLLHENDGGGRFTLRDTRAEARYAYSLAAADYDRDGDLDIYATRYSPVTDDPVDDSVDVPHPVPYHDAENGAPNVLLRNDGGWQFTDATESTGLDADNRRWSFAAAWHDYDGDGDQDLYVANDFGRNVLYRNTGGRFENVAADAGVEDVASGMSAAWGDVDGDGLEDLYVGNMFSSAGHRVTTQERFRPGSRREVVADLKRMARGNSLFLAREDGTYREAAAELGVEMGRWAWSSLFADLDNDGWQDIVVANGFLTARSPDDL